ncbi:GtrA family protein [Pseudodesulfovibrio sp.]|uniref:GtrA family protein n=1 Tax=unclassified Pseudodesulfovibrio TaxID=2661612 RepID=UPI003B00D3FA
MLSSLLELFRFGITGITSMVAYIVFSNVLYHLGLTVWPATATAWIIAALVSYFGHIHFSYKIKPEHKGMSIRFALMLAFHLIQTATLTYIFSDLLKLAYYATTTLTAFITPLATYPMGKFWVFKERKKVPSHE